jgi:hypothetical protein
MRLPLEILPLRVVLGRGTWWDICIIPALRRLRQKDPEFKAKLS